MQKIAVPFGQSSIVQLQQIGRIHAFGQEEPLAVAVYKALDWLKSALDYIDQGWIISKARNSDLSKGVEGELGLPPPVHKLRLILSG
jgi:hypothetical protein